MVKVNVPHFSYPVKFGADGHIAVVEQNSLEDVMSCVAVAAKTERGTRIYVPNFGITDPTFEESPIDKVTLAAEIRDSEPRSDNIINEKIDELVDNITIGVGLIEQ